MLRATMLRFLLTPARIGMALLCLALSAGGALAQTSDAKALTDRLERLERDLLTLQRQVYRGQTGGAAAGPQPSGSGAPTVISPEGIGRFESRVSALEDQLRDMTGRLEEVQFSISQLRERLDKLVSDIDYRLGALEQGRGGQSGGGANPPAAAGLPPVAPPAAAGGPPTPGQAQRQASPPTIAGQPPATGGTLGTLTPNQLSSNLPAAPANPPAAPSAGGRAAPAPGGAPAASILPDGPPSQQYQFAFNILAQNDYDQAERAFRAFLAAHPNDALAPDAQYWLASIYFVRNPPRYEEAAQLYAEAYQKFPNANRAPATLARLGISLSRLGRTREACVTFARFDEQFPNAAANLKSQVAGERQKANCK